MDVRTKDGWTPLAIACIYKSNECVETLLTIGG